MVTGANSGIGKASATELARIDASIVMVCRIKARGEEAKKKSEKKAATIRSN